MAETHPTLLFTDFMDTPGWRYQSEAPYSSIQGSIPYYADVMYMSKDFSDPGEFYGREIYRAKAMRSIAFSYLLTGDVKYLDKIIGALPYMYTSPQDSGPSTGEYALLVAEIVVDYCFMFDWLWHALYSRDPTLLLERKSFLLGKIRGNIISVLDDIYNYYGRIACACALGVAATCFPDEGDSGAWLNIATVNLCEQDTFPPDGRPILQGVNNLGGLCLIYSYKSYWIDNLLLWLNVQARNYSTKLSDMYPLVRNIVSGMVWEVLPNGRLSNYNTSGNTTGYMGYGPYDWQALGVVSSPYRSWHRWAIDTLYGEPSDKYSDLLYCVYDKHADIQSHPPDFTSIVPVDYEAAFFRGSWDKTADYLFFKFNKYPISSNRSMTHHDNMSFEYYSREDLLLIDSGEVKYRVSGYGPVDAKGHNLLMINNGEGTVGGAPKGMSGFTDFYNKAELKNKILASWVDFTEAGMDWKSIEDLDSGYYYNRKTINPVTWNRSIIYMDKDYFVIVDQLHGSVERDIHTLLHLGSFDKIETVYSGGGNTPGNVIGGLQVNDMNYDWLSKPYGVEYDTWPGQSIKWDTDYKTPLQMHIYTTPQSMISVEKFWCRIGGYKGVDEVDHPIIRLKTRAACMHRITAILTRETSEQSKTPADIPANIGSAISITSEHAEHVDYITAADGGDQVAGDIETNAETSLLRTTGGTATHLLVNKATYYRYKGATLFTSPTRKTEARELTTPGEAVINVDTHPVKGEIFLEGTSLGIAPTSTVVYAGTHTISFGDVDGYETPPPQTVTLNAGVLISIHGEYTEITPPEEATINVDTNPVKGEIFLEGTSLGIAPTSTTVYAGTYTLSFGDVDGYETPPPQTITVNAGEVTQITGEYTEITPPPPDKGTINVTTTPTPGDILINDVIVGNGTYTGEYDPGTYTLSFGDVDGYETPLPQTITVNAGEVTQITGEYTLKEKPKPSPFTSLVPIGLGLVGSYLASRRK